MKERSSTFRRAFQTLSIGMVLPVLLVVVALMAFSYRQYNHKYEELAAQSISLTAQNIRRSLGEVESFLSNLAVMDSDYALLTGSASPVAAHVAAHGIVTQFRTAIHAYSIADAFFVSSTANSTHRDVFEEAIPFREQEAVRSMIRSVAARGGNWYSTGWTVLEAGGKPYFFYLVGKDGTYLAAMVDFATSLTRWISAPEDNAFYVNADGLALNGADRLREEGIVLTGETPFYTGRDRNYLAVSAPLSAGGLTLTLLTPRFRPFDQFTLPQILLMAVSILAIINGVVLFLVSRKSILDPLEGLVRRVTQTESREEPDTPPYRLAELKQVDAAFADMQSTIHALQIEGYRKEIEKQKAELQYLQLQIRPHFYLNCLKTLYGMAQTNRTQAMQEMILAVSRHLRYCFSNTEQLIPLEEEIAHAANYLAIQNLGQDRSIRLDRQIEREARPIPVPPFSVQAFVENSVKYGRFDLEIRIEARLLSSEEGDFLDIVVSDNGGGFPAPQLDLLRESVDDRYDPNHIGLYNLRKRLALLYGDRCTTAFYNAGPGAVSEIILPLEKEGTP